MATSVKFATASARLSVTEVLFRSSLLRTHVAEHYPNDDWNYPFLASSKRRGNSHRAPKDAEQRRRSVFKLIFGVSGLISIDSHFLSILTISHTLIITCKLQNDPQAPVADEQLPRDRSELSSLHRNSKIQRFHVCIFVIHFSITASIFFFWHNCERIMLDALLLTFNEIFILNCAFQISNFILYTCYMSFSFVFLIFVLYWH